MIFLIVLLASLGLMFLIFLKPKSEGNSTLKHMTSLDSNNLTHQKSFIEAKKND